MVGRKYCGSIDDIKFVCPKCLTKYFLPIKSYNGRMLDALKKNGPIAISCPWCVNTLSGYHTVDLDNPKKWYGDPDAKPPKSGIYDVVYFDQDYELSREFEKAVKEKFPTVIIADGSDYIHGKRTTVELPGELRDDYITWLVLEGYAGSSFAINMALMGRGLVHNAGDDIEVIKKAIKIKDSQKEAPHENSNP
jgi:hypothetical protein